MQQAPSGVSTFLGEEAAHAAAQSKVEAHRATIASLNAEIQKLHAHMNSCLPVAQLPDEVLCVIFQILQEDEFPSNSRDKRDVDPHESPFTWIRVTHVCRRWRAVALAAPLLWVQPVMKNVCWAEIMMERSKNMPLVVRVSLGEGAYGVLDSCTTKEIEALRRCLGADQHLKRIKYLSIVNLHCFLDGLWNMAALPIRVPHLESLRLVGQTRENFNHIALRADTDALILPSESLRRVELSRMNVLWESPLFNHLTHLKLSHIAAPEPSPFFAVLKKLAPHLRVLHLRHSLPILGDIEFVEPYQSPRVHFEHLTQLLVSGKVPEVTGFFLSISFPTTTTFYLSLTMQKLQEEQLSTLFPILGCAYTTSLANVNFRTFVVDHYPSSESLRIQLHREAFETYATKSQWSVCFKCTDSSVSRSLQYGSAIKIFDSSGIVNMHSISHLHLDRARLPYNVLKTRLGRLDGISFIRVIGWSHHPNDVPRALSRSFDLHAKRVITFPGLKTIHFERVKFEHSNKELQIDDTYDMNFEMLKTCLSQRTNAGAPIRRLFITKCYCVEEADVIHLREIVEDGHVVWDEYDWSTYQFNDATSFHLHSTDMTVDDRHDDLYIPSEGDTTDSDDDEDYDEAAYSEENYKLDMDRNEEDYLDLLESTEGQSTDSSEDSTEESSSTENEDFQDEVLDEFEEILDHIGFDEDENDEFSEYF